LEENKMKGKENNVNKNAYAYIAIVAIVAIVAVVVMLSGGSKTKMTSTDLAGEAVARENNFISKGDINYAPNICQCLGGPDNGFTCSQDPTPGAAAEGCYCCFENKYEAYEIKNND
jgi:hypothetical protein